jgi:hypothetical protein
MVAAFVVLSLALVLPAAMAVLALVWVMSGRRQAPVAALATLYLVFLVVLPALALADVEPFDGDCPPDAHECYRDVDAVYFWVPGALLSTLATAGVISWLIASGPAPRGQP